MPSENVFDSYIYLGTTAPMPTGLPDELPAEIVAAWESLQEVENRHSHRAWDWGDVPRGDKTARTRRANKLFDLIRAAGLDAGKVTWKLEHDHDPGRSAP